MRYIYLSHLITDRFPIYGGIASVIPERVKSVLKGDSANTCRFTMENHWGTHVDAPGHFYEEGKKITDYPADFWFFHNPQVVNVELGPSEILENGEWCNTIDPQADILLFCSGWSLKRGKDEYYTDNPGIHPDVASYLRRHFTKLKAIGMDWISVSSYTHRELGRQVHRSFLNPEGLQQPVLIIEDMDLSVPLDRLRRVMASPLRINGMDSSPCTVIGEFID